MKKRLSQTRRAASNSKRDLVLQLDQLAKGPEALKHLDNVAEQSGAILEQKLWDDALELDTEKDDDPARQFLAKQGVKLKSAKRVLEKSYRYLEHVDLEFAGLGKRGIRSIEPLELKPEQLPPPVIGTALEEKSIGRNTIMTHRRHKGSFAIPKFVLRAVAESVKSHQRNSKRKYWHKCRQAEPEPVKKNLNQSIV